MVIWLIVLTIVTNTATGATSMAQDVTLKAVYTEATSVAQDSTLKEPADLNIFQRMLKGIDCERPFDALLVIHRNHIDDPRLDVFYSYPLPKVIISKQQDFLYRDAFNTEMLAVLVMANALDGDLLDATAQVMNFTRQNRIFMVAVNVSDQQQFRIELLNLSQTYRMTNVLLNFVYTNQKASAQYHMLKPYPQYHWQLEEVLDSPGKVYFPQHWRNMHNTSIVTYTSQLVPSSFIFEDPPGNVRLSGFVARLVMLFAEHYNASLRMYEPLSVDRVIHFSYINKLTSEHKLDIPMSVDTGQLPGKFRFMSDTYDMGKLRIIVPCARTMTIREVFDILLNVYFFGSVLVCTLILSLVHSFVDFCFDGLRNRLNFVLSDKILPGVLGQSFVARNSRWRGLKLVYLVLFFTGLNISTQFAANVNTLFTSPPYMPQIQSMNELLHSPVKILLNALEAANMTTVMHEIEKSCEIVANTTYIIEMQYNFNTTYAYSMYSALWDIFERRQQFFTQKWFCTTDELVLYDTIPLAIRLQLHSPYKEPLDYLIHRVHELGLVEAWKSSTFSDMLKMKKVSIRDPNPAIGRRVLNAYDFFWIWMIVLIGLALSTLVFLLELWFDSRARTNQCEPKNKKKIPKYTFKISH